MAFVVRSIYYAQHENWDHLSLLDDQGQAGFHFSLRPSHEIIAFNAMHQRSWGMQTEVPFDFSGVTYLVVTTMVTDTHAYVLINGDLLQSFQLDRPLARNCGIDSTMPCLRSYDLPGLIQGVPQIDGIGERELRGWAATTQDFPVEIMIAIGSAHFPARLHSAARPELAALADGATAQGWRAALGDEAAAAASAARTQSRPTRISLPIGGLAATGWINPPGVIEGFDGFRIQGWIDQNMARPAGIELRANGITQHVNAEILEKRWFADNFVLGTPAAAHDLNPVKFRIELPPSIWFARGAGDAIDLQICCDGIELAAGTIALSRGQAARWVEACLSSRTSPILMTALVEHVSGGGLLDFLAAPQRQTFAPLIEERASSSIDWVSALSRSAAAADATLMEVLRMDLMMGTIRDGELTVFAANHDIIMNVKARRSDRSLVCNQRIAGQWGEETIVCPLPDDWSNILIDAEINPHGLQLVVNGEPVQPVSDAGGESYGVTGARCRFVRRRSSRSLTAEPVPRPLPRNFISEFSAFVIRGEVCGGSNAPKIEVTANGKSLEGSVIASSRPSDANGTETYDFEFEIHGTIWTEHPASAEIAIEVHVDGAAVEPGPVIFTRSGAAAELMRIARQRDVRPQPQHIRLLALEHLALGKFIAEILPPDQDYYERFASEMSLTGFLHSGEAELSSALPGTAKPDLEVLEDLEVSLALGDLNRRFIEPGAPLVADMQIIIAERNLSGGALEKFCLALTPSLCGSGEILKLKQLLSAKILQELPEKDDAWSLAAAAALAAAGGEIGIVAKTLKKIADHYKGWLNTACVAFAVRETENAVIRHAASEDDVQRVRYELLAVQNRLSGDWFGRLHDEELVDSMLLLLRRCHYLPDYLSHDAERAALRMYGLSPRFWRSRFASPLDHGTEITPLLAAAQQHFDRLSRAVESPVLIDQQLPRITAALQFFHAHGNPESLFWMREIAAQVMRSGGAADPPAIDDLLALLLSAEPNEAVRIAAFPGDQKVAGRLSNITPLAVIPHAIRRINGRPTAATFYTQREVCRALAAGIPEDPEARSQLSELIEVLSSPWASYLGADLRAVLAVRSPQTIDPIAFDRFEDILHRFLSAPGGAGELPAPLAAALARIRAHPQSAADPYRSRLADLEHAITRNFEGGHAAALTKIAAPAISLDESIIGGDTLVVVYSCNAYLDTRIAAIRETWMSDLKARRIPCIVMVGDGDGELHGDVLRLSVSDAYDDLPAKTLGLIKWVTEKTNFRYLIKIDDDCYLSAEHYFGTLEYRAHHYYGRLVIRKIGATDRTWHHKKSEQVPAKRIDLSPEPSTYADGGGVYSLSRFAMTRVLQTAATMEGQRLIAHSFMEDKLLGDLLRLAGIIPSDVDYSSYQRRRTFSAAIPVGMWEESFFPSAIAPTKVVHLDRHTDQAPTHALRDQSALYPKKIWPSFEKVSVNYTVSQLELLSPLEVLCRAMQDQIGVICAVRNEMTILPHFLAHYRSIGVNWFFFIDNTSDDGTREFLLTQPDVVLYSVGQEYKLSHFGVAWQQAVLSNHFLGRWAVVADADEFLIYPDWKVKPLAGLVAEAAAEGADAVPLLMVDMYPYGSLDDADFTRQSPFEAAPWCDREPVAPYHFGMGFYSNRVQQVSTLRHRLMPDSEPAHFVAEKIALFRYQPWIRLSEGLHGAANVTLSRVRANFAHFKYHKGFRKKVAEEIGRNQHFADAIEYRRYAALFAESYGDFGDPETSAQLGPDGFTPEPANPA